MRLKSIFAPSAAATAATAAMVAAFALLAASGSAHATITVYTTQTSYLAAVSAAGVDTFNDLSFLNTASAPQPRAAGAYAYTANVGPASNFYPAGDVPSDVWLAPDNRTDTITFDAFPAGVSAAGGFFFRVNASGVSTTTPATINISVTDGSGTVTQALVNPVNTSFLGFVSDGPLTNMKVWVGVAGTGTTDVWPSINDLTLGVAAAVPEPGSCALMLGGLAAVAYLARRRKA